MDENKLIELQQYAELLFSPEEICIIMELPAVDFKHRFLVPGDEIYKHYQAGKLKTIAVHRRMILKLAEEGSSPAQAEVTKMISQLETREI